MVKKARIRCVTKTGREAPHECISDVGGLNASGTRWKQSQQQTISEIESGTWEFFVTREGETAGVIVASHQGHKYLKTRGDGLYPHLLLALPECP
jgi:hypothetical protein